jgi:hypothetical protein
MKVCVMTNMFIQDKLDGNKNHSPYKGSGTRITVPCKGSGKRFTNTRQRDFGTKLWFQRVPIQVIVTL